MKIKAKKIKRRKEKLKKIIKKKTGKKALKLHLIDSPRPPQTYSLGKKINLKRGGGGTIEMHNIYSSDGYIIGRALLFLFLFSSGKVSKCNISVK